MKKLLFIVLLSIVYLTTTTEFKQFLKLPILIVHYFEHNHSIDQLGVVDYLLIHYSYELVNDGDSDRDNQLPFKTSTHTSSKTITATVPLVSITVNSIFQIHLIEKITVKNHTNTLKGFSGTIWHPPKLV